MGFLINFAIFYWLINTLHLYGSVKIIHSILIIGLMAVYLGLYWGIFGLITALVRGQPIWLKIVNLVGAWTLLSFAKGHIITGFPWGNLEYSQYLNRYFIQVTDITGPYLLGGIILLIGYLLYRIICEKFLNNSLKYVLSILIILILTYGYGIIRLNTIEPVSTITAGAIQPCLVPEIKDNPKFYENNFNLYLKQSYRIAKSNKSIDLILWPETALRSPLSRDIGRLERLIQFANEFNTGLLVGNEDYYYKFKDGKRELILHNGAYFIFKDKESSSLYYKKHLVPFGEFIPLRDKLFFVKKYTDQLMDFTPGKKFKVFSMKNGKIRPSVLICYEIIFPEGVSRYVKNGSNVLCNLTNNIWYGHSAGPLQDVAFTVFRAVETKTPVVRSANNGVSIIVSGTGVIQTSLPIDERGVIYDEVEIYNKQTFFVKTPYLVPVLLIILIVIFNFIPRFKDKLKDSNK